MVYLLAIASAVFYGAADFAGGLATRRSGATPVVLLSQASGLVLLALILPLLPHASPTMPDLLWGAGAGVTGGVGVALLYRALAIGTMAVDVILRWEEEKQKRFLMLGTTDMLKYVYG